MGICKKKMKLRKPRKPRKPGKRQRGRVRQRAEWVSYPWVMTHIQTSPQMEEPKTENRPIYVERMVDDNDYTKWQNPCRHEVYAEQGEILRPQYPRSILDMTVVADSAPLPDWHHKLITNIPPIPHDLQHELALAAEDHFKNAVKPTVKLANFLLELALAAKKGITVAAQGVKTLKDLEHRFNRLFEEFLKKGYKEVDAHYLAYKFAIAPALRDLVGIYCSLEQAQKRAQWLVKHNGVEVRVRYARPKVWQPDLSTLVIYAGKPGGYYYGSWNPSCPPWVGGCVSPEREEIAGDYLWIPTKFCVDYHAQANVIYRLPPFRLLPDGKGGIDGWGLVWGSMMGLDRFGSFLWEAIPFSFMLDWFTDFGKNIAALLDELTKQFPDGEIRSAGHSYKLVSEWDAVYDISTSESGYGEHLGSSVFTYYVRREGLHSESALPLSFDTGGISQGERPLLTLALVIGALAYKKRRRPVNPSGGWIR